MTFVNMCLLSRDIRLPLLLPLHARSLPSCSFSSFCCTRKWRGGGFLSHRRCAEWRGGGLLSHRTPTPTPSRVLILERIFGVKRWVRGRRVP
jgi:hypothetical protein